MFAESVNLDVPLALLVVTLNPEAVLSLSAITLNFAMDGRFD